MPGHLQEGFGCVVTNRFDQLFDDESDPFEVLKEAENKKKDGGAPGAAKTAAQAAKQPRKESQKDRKNPLLDKKEETQAQVPLKKEGIRRVGRRPDQQAPHQGQPGSQQQGGPVEGRPVEGRPAEGRPTEGRPTEGRPTEGRPAEGRSSEGRPAEGRPSDRRPDRRPPRERRFDKPSDEKPEGGEFSVEKPAGDRPMRGRGGGGRGGRGGRGRGMGRGDGFDSRGKREFDRHSGSDRSSLKAEEKRGGSGSHNWGTVKDELSGLDQSNVTEETAEGEEHPPADSENKENEVEEVKEEGPKEMTLDEWKAVQDKERAKVEFNIRKANEGADSQWKKGYVLHKSKSDEKPPGTLIDTAEVVAETPVFPKVPADDSTGDHHFRKPANDITSQLEINFGDLGRPGRGRGAPRGGPRGGRGGRGGGERGGERGERGERGGGGGERGAGGDHGGGNRPARGGRSDKPSGVSVPNVDDPEAFPALA